MDKRPLFSIVIVSYNYGRYIESTLLSILNQRFEDYELIIIDGGSKDNTVDVLRKYDEQIDFWISEKDNGQSDAFNKGFAKAKGEYLFWVNADDILLRGALESLRQFIVKHRFPDWIAGNTVYFNDDGKIVKCVNGPRWHRCLLENAPIYVYGPTTVFKASVLAEVGPFDEKLSYMMDTDLWIRFIRRGYKFKRIKRYLWGFRFHGESKTTHTFFGEDNAKIVNERKYMLEKNSYKYLPAKVKLQKLYKIFSGLYLKSWMDTYRLKGKDINNFSN